MALPLECQAKIVKEVHLQDLSFRKARRVGRVELKTVWHGHGLSALRLTSHAMNDLATPLLVGSRVVHAYELAEPFFAFVVRPKFSQYIRQITLRFDRDRQRGYRRSNYQQLISYLPHLPKLSHISVESCPHALLEHLGFRQPGEQPVQDHSQDLDPQESPEVIAERLELCRTTFRQVASRITSISLSMMNEADMAAALEMFFNLETVSIRNRTGGSGQVLPALRKLRHVKSLSVDDTISMWRCADEAWEGELTSLSVEIAKLEDNSFSFTSHFSSTLEHLVIHFPRFHHHHPTSRLTTPLPHFPLLAHLDLTMPTPQTAIDFLTLLAQNEHKALVAALAPYGRTLTNLTYQPALQPHNPFHYSHLITDFAVKHVITLSPDPSAIIFDQFRLADIDPLRVATFLAERRTTLESLFSFAQILVKSYQQTSDIKGLGQVAITLAPLRASFRAEGGGTSRSPLAVLAEAFDVQARLISELRADGSYAYAGDYAQEDGIGEQLMREGLAALEAVLDGAGKGEVQGLAEERARSIQETIQAGTNMAREYEGIQDLEGMKRLSAHVQDLELLKRLILQ
ncbi:hypothetical protein RQP46_006624 [Phenoliferia psychrophenolica]